MVGLGGDARLWGGHTDKTNWLTVQARPKGSQSGRDEDVELRLVKLLGEYRPSGRLKLLDCPGSVAVGYRSDATSQSHTGTNQSGVTEMRP